jgi:hypothetical protein
MSCGAVAVAPASSNELPEDRGLGVLPALRQLITNQSGCALPSPKSEVPG